MKPSKTIILSATVAALALFGCQSTVDHPLYQSSGSQPVNGYHSFDEYLSQTERQLSQHRYYLTENKQQELKANMPFELRPQSSKEQAADNPASSRKGILLIHGLGDSPYSFVDISQSLVENGFLVRSILLDGHGTRPADMMNADHEQWQKLVNKQVELLEEEVEEVYLGGFSTGGNLAYLHAADNSDIAGLMLFSPGFQSNEPMAFMTPLLSSVRPWLRTNIPNGETNYTRYSNMPTNGFAQYYHTSKATMEDLDKRQFDRPTFMVLTEHDSVLDTKAIKDIFQTRFTHPDNKLMWYGTSPKPDEDNVVYVNSRVPELRVSNMSHMGVLYSPKNPYYGINGSETICRNGQESQEAEDYCLAGGEVWYSAWDHREPDKVHARLTFNPYYDQMIDTLSEVFEL
ncbi:alpha/beta fold hydrolase [Photobacterium sp. BZF1]|uniref:alpha/beta hydrolase n=1 Tax=Photobacterium sp. BZF1 TaxID=1904457 RepID=UPI00165360A4|nr:alpha/beta fold hydrolase [Photobacterium sp. BZF1]MBC7001577.1 alpha/beta fold hydrolase [Photobacterium sp. BZF1]